MQTLQKTIQDKFTCFNHLSPDVREEQIKSVFYIERMATLLKIDMRNVDLFKTFSLRDSGIELLTGKGALNKKLATLQSMPPSVAPKEINELTRDALKYLATNSAEKRILKLERELETSLNNLRVSCRTVGDWTSKVAKLYTERESYLGATFDFTDEFKKIESSGAWELFNANETCISWVNTSPVSMRYLNLKAGIDYTVNLGIYRAAFNLINSTINIYSHKGNFMARESYIHPYVNTAGNICFGSHSYIAAAHLAKLEIADYLEILDSLLRTYSIESAPYSSLDNFKIAIENGDAVRDFDYEEEEEEEEEEEDSDNDSEDEYQEESEGDFA